MELHRIISWYASLSVIMGPILQPYNLYGKSVALLLMFFNILFFSVYGITRKQKIFIRPDRKYLIFLIYSLTLPILLGITLYKVDVGASVRGILVFSVSLFCYLSFANIKDLKKIYKYFVYLAIGVFFAQEICWHIYDFRFPALIPFLELNYEMGMEEFLKVQLIQERSSSIFLEPAHFAIFVLPYLAIKMIDNEKIQKAISFETLFLSIVLVYLRSGIGFVCMMMIWLIFMTRLQISKRRKMSIIMSGFLFFILVVIFTDLSTFLYDSFFSRSAEITGDSSHESGMIRVYRGFLVYDDFPLIGKLFGVSNGAIEDVVRHSSAANLFDDIIYINNAQKLLIGYGFVGVFSFLCYLRGVVKRNPYSTYLILLFLLICFMENMLFDSRMMLYLAIGALPYNSINRINYDKKSIYNY